MRTIYDTSFQLQTSSCAYLLLNLREYIVLNSFLHSFFQATLDHPDNLSLVH